MKVLQACIWLAGMGLLLFCSKPNESVSTDPSRQENLTDVAYGADSKQKFNIYLPAGRSESTTPVLFFLYGGAWIEGDKNLYTYFIPELREAFPTYAFVLVNYRLFNWAKGTNKFPSQEQDVKACIEKVLNNSGQYQISRKFAVWGQSAGAHLATLYAYKYGSSSFRPKAVVDQAGPVDMLSFYRQIGSSGFELKNLLAQLMGNPNSADTVLYHSSSPLRYVDRNSPPTLILHGSADELVPYQQARQLKDKLQQNGVPHVYKLYAGEGHDLTGVETEANQQVISFLQAYLN